MKRTVPIPQTIRIALVGAPSSGKSATLAYLEHAVINANYNVSFIPEAATSFLAEGNKKDDNAELFQLKLMFRQILAENKAEERAAKTKTNAFPTVIITDRSLADFAVYVDSDFGRPFDLSVEDALNRYAAILYFQPYLPGISSNPFRRETTAEVMKIDSITRNIYAKHQNFFEIPTMPTVQDRGNNVKFIINHLLQNHFAEPLFL